ncbi:MAG: mandelate racemase/muconate lactonizing enzyme family protein [Francisellaceae bacterium]
MKITSLKCQYLSYPLKRRFITAIRQTDHITDILVKITLDNGLVGYGSAPATTAITGDTLSGMKSVIEDLFTPVLLHSNLMDYQQSLNKAFTQAMHNTGAKMAVDLAIHDLLAKTANQPLSQWLGANHHQLETDVSISCAPISDTLQAIDLAISKGFTCIKIKMGGDFNRDLALVSQLQQLPDSIKLRLDANQGWTKAQTLSFFEHISRLKLNIELLEQPVKAFDLKALAEITRRSPIPILADESVFDIQDARTIIELKAADIINIKLAKTGGILAASQIKKVADAHGITCMIGSMMESPLGIAAAASFACANNITMADLDPLDWIDKHHYQHWLTFNEPVISLSSKSGLAFEPSA